MSYSVVQLGVLGDLHYTTRVGTMYLVHSIFNPITRHGSLEPLRSIIIRCQAKLQDLGFNLLPLSEKNNNFSPSSTRQKAELALFSVDPATRHPPVKVYFPTENTSYRSNSTPTGRIPYRKTTSQEDNLTGRQHHRKTTHPPTRESLSSNRKHFLKI